MNAVDGSNHYQASTKNHSPSLLFIVLDTNPHAWALLAPELPLSGAVANLIVFINAHLAINNANQVAVVASHCHRPVWLYPQPPLNSDDSEMSDATSKPLDNTNKYRPFALVESSILASLRELIITTTEDDVSSTTSTQMASALTLALSYINKASVKLFGSSSGGAETSLISVDSNEKLLGLQSRILVISVSGDLAQQYIPIMNVTFAAQRLGVPIDICKLAGDTVFLQQASDASKGVYMYIKNPKGFLQYLMMAFLPDLESRKHLVVPTQGTIDFRAACFCHRKVVDIGFVCSVCLSIFCSPPEGTICRTCSTQLTLGDYGAKPAVVPRKKRKKKHTNGTLSNTAAVNNAIKDTMI
ncbi:General transcription and DNA repair factor IIH subunit tfb4 [Erysiphe necator]|uniref:General transcription and DNA repair factor IIH subunit TFB4 n=1 Tax=Uncinula necator TaxID=52586 RepID=A0A0B1PES0_UNCNE|nr:General transcription and DNA repair factor IIH subunit tfb4 [Erysiphe necator]KHJ35134.1 putative transcription factor tfiih subunit [Erysiphe necator]